MRLRLLALPLVASLAWCQALDQAKRAFDSGDYAAAARLFEQAQMSSPSCEIHFFLGLDRKSTRLNSSHSQISYAVFCLKKHSPAEDLAAGGAGRYDPAAPGSVLLPRALRCGPVRTRGVRYDPGESRPVARTRRGPRRIC